MKISRCFFIRFRFFRPCQNRKQLVRSFGAIQDENFGKESSGSSVSVFFCPVYSSFSLHQGFHGKRKDSVTILNRLKKHSIRNALLRSPSHKSLQRCLGLELFRLRVCFDELLTAQFYFRSRYNRRINCFWFDEYS